MRSVRIGRDWRQWLLAALGSLSSSVLLIPIEQVDRIEIIRGPGLSLHGRLRNS